MKMLKVISLLFALSLALSSFALAQGTGCVLVSGTPTGKRVDNYFYTDCYPDVGDDTTRLQTAISAAAGSTLIFNESDYQVSGHLNISPYTTLEGLAAAEGNTISKITLTANNESIFRIGTGMRAINIKNLGLYTTNSTTYGIEALGTTGSSSSQLFHFSNLWIKGFTKGIYVHTTDGDK